MIKLKLLKQFQNYYGKANVIPLVILLLLTSSSIFSASYSQRELRLSFKNTKIETIISFIEKTTDYRFLYQTSQVDLKRKISINYRGNIAKAVNILFNNTAVYAVIMNKQIILKERISSPQQRTISGTVTDEAGFPISDVTVLLNKDEKFAITDFDGKYSISAKTGDVLEFTYIGHKDKKIVVGQNSVINIVLEEDISLLDEVVLIGYGKEKRENVSTAISSIKGGDLKTNIQSGASFDRGLDGLVKGVFVTQGSGELGKSADVIIRGVTSPFSGGNNNPLYIIDGVAIPIPEYNPNIPVNSNPLQSINPEDIESIEVLKDAAATAIYGSRGANGVIIVKTKTGMYNQRTTVSLSFKTTVGVPGNTLDYLNAAEFKEYINIINRNSLEYYNNIKSNTIARKNYGREVLSQLLNFGFYQAADSTYKYNPSKIKFKNADTNWNDVVFRNAITNTLNASVSGGGEKSLYNLSLGYTNQEGILRGEEKEQYNARLSTQFDISNKIKVGASANYTNVSIQSGYNVNGVNSASGSTFTSLGSGILRFRPDLPVYDQNGALLFEESNYINDKGKTETTLYPNPLMITTLSSQSSGVDNSILTNIFAEYNITNELLFKADFSYGLFLSDAKSFKPSEYLPTGSVKRGEGGVGEIKGLEELAGKDAKQADLTELSMGNSNIINSSINYTLQYTKQLDKSTVKGLLGFSHTRDKSTIDDGTYRDFILNVPLPQNAKINRGRNRQTSRSGLNSYFTRVSYNYDEKYGVSGVVRLDRSSKFAPKNRNAFFPSIAANWNIHREKFMDNSFLSDLRLRASAGLTGSVTTSGDFDYLQKFIVGGLKYKNIPVSTFDPELGNEELTWEKTTEYNLGLDFGLKRNIVSGSIDFYHKTTSDVVSNDYEVVSSGRGTGPRNNAKMLNKGVEISLRSDIINNEKFTWSVSVNASKNINKILEVSNAELDRNNSDGNYVIGREINVIQGLVVNGIIQTPERLQELQDYAKSKGKEKYDPLGLTVGDYEFKDLNGDGTIDSRDRVILGSRQPDLFGGFNTNMRYKDFSLAANFTYALGLESVRTLEGLDFGRFQNIQRNMGPEYRWSPTNTSATLPRLIHRGSHNSSSTARTSSANIFDASYLRLASLRLGYNLPQLAISNLGFSSINIYISGTNLATWTRFPGLDPQGAGGGAASTDNTINTDAYPLAKTFSLGLNLKF